MSTIKVGSKEYTPEEIVTQAIKAPNWFRAIAIFSLINTVIHYFKTDLNFVIGLAATLFVDALMMGFSSHGSGTVTTVVTIIGIGVNLLLIGTFFLFWYLSKQGSKATYIIGMVLYFLDGLLFLLIEDWVGIAFHLFFLFMLWGGYQFVKRRGEAEGLLASRELSFEVLQPEAQSPESA